MEEEEEEEGEKSASSSRVRIRAQRRANLVHRYIALKEQKRTKKKKKKNEKDRGENRKRRNEIPIRPGELKFFCNVLAAVKSRNAGCSRGGAEEGEGVRFPDAQSRYIRVRRY